MNDRIRELAEHCDFYVGNEHYDKSHEEQQRLFMEKFAELIVQECAKVIYRQTLMATPEHHWSDWEVGFNEGIDAAKKKVKEHFGVEE